MDLDRAVPKVKCESQSCNFWIPGDLCVAGFIEVTNNEKGRDASSREETMCKTFSPRVPEIEMDAELNEKLKNLLTDSGVQDPGIHPEVSCIVDSCKYWGSGDKCIKSNIEILYKESLTPQETACEDYKPKGVNTE